MSIWRALANLLPMRGASQACAFCSKVVCFSLHGLNLRLHITCLTSGTWLSVQRGVGECNCWLYSSVPEIQQCARV